MLALMNLLHSFTSSFPFDPRSALALTLFPRRRSLLPSRSTLCSPICGRHVDQYWCFPGIIWYRSNEKAARDTAQSILVWPADVDVIHQTSTSWLVFTTLESDYRYELICFSSCYVDDTRSFIVWCCEFYDDWHRHNNFLLHFCTMYA